MSSTIYLLFTILISCTKNFKLQEGDLLFQDLDSSPLCNAIELVTPGYNGANFSHIGLVVSVNDTLKVLEAIPPKVMTTNLDDFINRSFDKNGNPKVIVGRLKKEFINSISNAVSYSKSKLVDEPNYNIKLGSYYLASLLESYEGSYVFWIPLWAHVSSARESLSPMLFIFPNSGSAVGF